MDIEGQPSQELSAIVMSVESRQIVDVYHKYAQSNEPDDWARQHVHGLNPSFLQSHGFADEAALVSDFKKWLRGRDILVMYANAPHKEKTVLNLPVLDMGLPCWERRTSLLSHQTALAFKRNSMPILSTTCCADAHRNFKFYPSIRNSPMELAKQDFGHHCSLYDVYALYLHYNLD